MQFSLKDLAWCVSLLAISAGATRQSLAEMAGSPSVVGLFLAMTAFVSFAAAIGSLHGRKAGCALVAIQLLAALFLIFVLILLFVIVQATIGGR